MAVLIFNFHERRQYQLERFGNNDSYLAIGMYVI